MELFGVSLLLHCLLRCCCCCCFGCGCCCWWRKTSLARLTDWTAGRRLRRRRRRRELHVLCARKEKRRGRERKRRGKGRRTAVVAKRLDFSSPSLHSDDESPQICDRGKREKGKEWVWEGVENGGNIFGHRFLRQKHRKHTQLAFLARKHGPWIIGRKTVTIAIM